MPEPPVPAAAGVEVDGFSSSLRGFHIGTLPFIVQLRRRQNLAARCAIPVATANHCSLDYSEPRASGNASRPLLQSILRPAPAARAAVFYPCAGLTERLRRAPSPGAYPDKNEPVARMRDSGLAIRLQQHALHLLLTLSVCRLFRLVMNDRPLPYRTSTMRALAALCILLASLCPARRRLRPANHARRAGAPGHPERDERRLSTSTSSPGRSARITDTSTQVEHLVDTPQRIVSRVVLIDGKPLSPASSAKRRSASARCCDPAQMRRKL